MIEPKSENEDGMTIGGRRIMMKRRWLALLSLAWVAGVYIAWTLLYSPSVGAMWDRGRAQCASFGSYPYAYAECMKFAAQVANNHQTGIAETAALIAILPVALLWLLWSGTRFLQVCRSAECDRRISRYGVAGRRR
jgi:hypothetical protein